MRSLRSRSASTFLPLHEKMELEQSQRRRLSVEQRRLDLQLQQKPFRVADPAHPVLHHRSDKHVHCVETPKEEVSPFKVRMA